MHLKQTFFPKGKISSELFLQNVAPTSEICPEGQSKHSVWSSEKYAPDKLTRYSVLSIYE